MPCQPGGRASIGTELFLRSRGDRSQIVRPRCLLRVHLDDCDASNGALRVIPGSHRRGRLAPDQILAAKAAAVEVLCEAAAGDALLMRPFLLHASSKSVTDRRRRILHVEYCSGRLPAGMTWHDAA